VVAIKMTVYRTGTDSVLMQSLLRAAQNGKEVTVVVELMARFDEEANIGWATKLEEVGAHVIYGVVGYKTHAKMLMIVRREESKAGGSVLRRYVHLGTGNYHPKTARLYSDFGLLTCNEDIGADANEVFKQLTGLGRAQTLKHLWQAPFSLQPNVVAGIRAEAEAARAGKRSRIIAKMNSLARTGDHRCALRSLAGRRQDRPHRARRLRLACRRQGPVREHQRLVDHRSTTRTSSRVLFLRRRRRRKSICRAPTGWSATSSAASNSLFRSSTAS
jgi:hypothetical protein